MSELNFKILPECVATAIVNTFQIQLSSKAAISKVSRTAEPRWLESTSCLSSLPMQSGDLLGALALGMPDTTLLKIIEKMTGEKHAELTPEISDAAGEILNIVYTSARREINNNGGFNFSPSLPSTVIGSRLRLAMPELKDKTLFFYCDSELGDFYLAFSLRSTKSKVT